MMTNQIVVQGRRKHTALIYIKKNADWGDSVLEASKSGEYKLVKGIAFNKKKKEYSWKQEVAKWNSSKRDEAWLKFMDLLCKEIREDNGYEND